MARKKKRYDRPRHMPVRKGDVVQVLVGRDGPHAGEPGKQGRVLRTYPQTGHVIVEGVRIVRRHTKPNPQRGIKGGVMEKASKIHVSNVRVIRRAAAAGE